MLKILPNEIVQIKVNNTNLYASLMRETKQLIERMDPKKRSFFNVCIVVTFDEIRI